MKKIILLFLLLPFIVNAQNQYITQITHQDLNSVDQKMQDFMNEEMGMIVDRTPTFTNKGNTLNIRYIKHATLGTPKHLYFKYTTFEDPSKSNIIKSCVISGFYDYVLDFYLKYWLTLINTENMNHGEIAYSYYLNDKASLKLNPADKSGSITVSFNTIIQ